MRNENKRLAAVVLGILTISKGRLNLVLKRIIVLISSKFVYSAPVKRLENQENFKLIRNTLQNKLGNPESLKK